MANRGKNKSFWEALWGSTSRRILLVGDILYIIIRELIVDRFIGWGNGMIDNWLLTNHNLLAGLLSWVLKDAFHVTSALAVFIILYIVWRSYTETRKQNSAEYCDVDISYYVIAETIEEKRTERQTRRPTETRRLPYLIKNTGGAGIKGCRIKMTSLVLRDSPHNYYDDTTHLPIEDKSIKWTNSESERIGLGIDSPELIILAKIPNYSAIPLFHFVVWGDEKKNLNEKVARVFEGTWDVGIQIEGQIEKNGIVMDLEPIGYTISFRFEDFSLRPLEITKHERKKEEK